MQSLSLPPLHRRPGRRDRESGSTAIEFVFWTPLLLIILLALVQIGLYLFAEHVAATAAQAGARAGRQDEPGDPGGWQAPASAAAVAWVNELIGSGVAGPVTATPTIAGVTRPVQCAPPVVTVQVAFTMNSLFGGMHVHAQSAGPVENFYPDC